MQQAASLTTLNTETHIVLRLFALGARGEFLRRYGDTGEDEFDNRTGTIPQRLLMMNGELVHDQTKEGLFTAASRIAAQARDDHAAVRIAYLAVLTREPTSVETDHFEKRLADTAGNERRWAAHARALLGLAQFNGVRMEPLDFGRCPPAAADQPRRICLRGTSLAGLCWLTPVGQLLTSLSQEPGQREPAQSIILLWLAGGPSQLETFDPHPNTAIAGDTGAVNTSVPGVQLADGYPQLAEQMASLAIIRSVVSREGDHERGTYNLMTGYRPDPTVIHPSIGAICAHQLPVGQTEIPRYITILPGQWPGRGGYLGDQYDPFKTGDPLHRVPDVTSLVSPERDAQRMADLDVVEQAFARRRSNRVEATQHRATVNNARTMMSSEQLRAFDVNRESAELRAAYGNTPFGRGCLAARRLIEVGVRCVEVTLSGWDTHANNHAGHRAQAAILDPAFSALVRDLKDHNLFHRTVVI